MADYVKLTESFLNSQAVSGFFGAAFGAISGALVASKTTRDAERKKELLSRIRGLNTALTLTNGVMNAFTALKRQHVKPTQEELARVRKNYDDWRDLVKRVGSTAGPFYFDADLRTMEPPIALLAELQKALFERCDPDATTLGLYQWLSNAVAHTISIVEQRNRLLEEFRSFPSGSDEAVVRLYLGLKRKDGNTDARYPNLVEGMRVQCDDVLVFARMMIEQLQPLATSAVEAYGKDAPKALQVSFADFDKSGLMPDLTEHQELLRRLGVARFAQAPNDRRA